MSKLTIKTLAKELGLSIATVSKALKDSHEISSETKKKVLAMAEQLNYVPNPYASSLRKQKSKTIAVILPEVADNFFSLAINGIQSVAETKNYHVLIYLSHESFEIEKNTVNHCLSGRVDGVLLSVSSETSDAAHFEKLKNENIPFVFFDREFENFAAPKIITNDYECGFLAAKLLLSKGCKHPAFLSTSENLSICSKRSAGFTAALTEEGFIKDKHEFVIDCTGTPDTIFDQVQELLKNNPQIDGIVASVERLAMQIYMVSVANSITIPKELKVVAFSTLETAPILNPSLTTITQPAFEIGKTAAEVLFTMIEKKKHNITADSVMILPSTLIERNSTLA
ncbi:LacI family transcriptional regulator [Lacibacter luteus]|uniref:LacI family transcriptional regulator n=1 Tax=Lacibacter luteus TaxID=2508719 RepID=A0A4Q1CE80_9BACT|nr:LacI family DNA-binding transcriptional regulator [Lacibacter luteus]RXK57736.1 LacI family transcriptional regulator [Lacibacter luteus]